MLLHNQRPPQRHHKQHAEKAADQRQHKDARVLQIEAEKNQRRQRKNYAGGDRLPRVAGGLDDDVLQNRTAPERPQNADRQHRDRNGGGHRKPGAQAHINCNGAKDDAEKRAEQNGAKSKLRTFLAGGNKGLKVGHG